MAILRDLDVFALTDSDSEEARTFTTYGGYWAALADHVEAEFGSIPFQSLFEALVDNGLTRLASKPSSCADAPLRTLLLNAWSSELAGCETGAE